MWPLYAVCFQAAVGMAARLGYDLTASPLRYEVRSAHRASTNCGRFGVAFQPWLKLIRSGRLSPAIMVAVLVNRSVNEMGLMRTVAPSCRFTSCQARF